MQNTYNRVAYLPSNTSLSNVRCLQTSSRPRRNKQGNGHIVSLASKDAQCIPRTLRYIDSIERGIIYATKSNFTTPAASVARSFIQFMRSLLFQFRPSASHYPVPPFHVRRAALGGLHVIPTSLISGVCSLTQSLIASSHPPAAPQGDQGPVGRRVTSEVSVLAQWGYPQHL